jgi:hypothetical protein
MREIIRGRIRMGKFQELMVLQRAVGQGSQKDVAILI